MFREYDTVTQYIRKHWNRGDDPAWKFVLGRMLNWPESLEVINLAWLSPEQDRLKLAKDAVKYLRSGGAKVFTSAYTISTCGKSMDKLDYVFDWVVQAVAEAGEPDYDTLASTAENLGNIDGLGTFLAGQVVADMKNTYAHPLRGAPDWWDWSAPGPGSLRGLNWYFYGEPSGHITAATYDARIKICYSEVVDLIGEKFPRISMQDFQNCLCEFSKYCKVKFLGGHVRNTYPGVA